MSFDNEYDDLDLRQQREIDNLINSGQIPDFRDRLGNGNGHNNTSPEGGEPSKPNTNDIVFRKLPADRNYFEYLVKTIQKTVKFEDALIRQVLYTAFSAYIEDDPQNLLIIESTSEGKTYTITQSLQYFPDKDVMYIGQMSSKVLVRQNGIRIDKDSGEPIEPKINELKIQIRKLRKEKNKLPKGEQDRKADIDDEIDIIEEQIRTVYENSKTLINLTGKILVFLEPPNHDLWVLLKPILSHDKKDMEFPFVDKDSTSNAKTKDVVVRGWPACIFCSARDESQWKIWPEIKSRMPITSPITDPQKYKEANKLTTLKKGFPKSIQQKIIISDEHKEVAKDCVLTIKDTIDKLKKQNHGLISVWIPYNDLLDQEMPANKGPDMRFTNRVFALLNIVPIIKHNHRSLLLLEDEKSVIADLTDLKEVLSISHNLDGLPRSKAKFYNDVFLDLFNQRVGPDSKTDKNGKVITEEIRAVTCRQLFDHFKTKTGKPINTDNMKHTYLNPLINEGIIDYTKSEINGKENIYYPLVTEPLSIT